MNNSLFHENMVNSKRILYTPSAFAKTNLIYLQEIGTLQAQQIHTSSRKNLSSYLFFIVLSGSGTLEYNNIKYSLKTGDCIFLNCKNPYLHRTSENLWKLKWVHFYGINMNNIYDKYLEQGGLSYFQSHNFSSYEKILDDLYTIADSSDNIKDMKIFEKLTSLITLLMEDNIKTKYNFQTSSKKQNLQEIKDYLEQHYKERITLDQLSEIFFINKFYLTRIFKTQFGISINNYLMQLKITHAKNLLRFSDMSIENIGNECGIDDPNYFARMFKKVEGITPGEFRRKWRE